MVPPTETTVEAVKSKSTRFEGECHWCLKKGHMVKDCWDKQAGGTVPPRGALKRAPYEMNAAAKAAEEVASAKPGGKAPPERCGQGQGRQRQLKGTPQIAKSEAGGSSADVAIERRLGSVEVGTWNAVKPEGGLARPGRTTSQPRGLSDGRGSTEAASAAEVHDGEAVEIKSRVEATFAEARGSDEEDRREGQSHEAAEVKNSFLQESRDAGRRGGSGRSCTGWGPSSASEDEGPRSNQKGRVGRGRSRVLLDASRWIVDPQQGVADTEEGVKFPRAPVAGDSDGEFEMVNGCVLPEEAGGKSQSFTNALP
jgi:hypothetical protein